MLPPKLKNFALFDSGYSLVGQVNEVSLGKIKLKTDEYRAGGMLGAISADMGIDPQAIEWKCGTIVRQALREFGVARADGVLLRFVGAYQADDTGAVFPAELVVRGRHTEIDPGTAKMGDANEFSVTTAWTYLKWTVNGAVDLEVDLVNCVLVSGGVDRMAEIRAALGI